MTTSSTAAATPAGTPVRLWDLPVRLVHWSFVIGIGLLVERGEPPDGPAFQGRAGHARPCGVSPAVGPRRLVDGEICELREGARRDPCLSGRAEGGHCRPCRGPQSPWRAQ